MCVSAASAASPIRDVYELGSAVDVTELRDSLIAAQQRLRDAEEIAVYNAIVNSISAEDFDKKIAALTQTSDALYTRVRTDTSLSVSELLELEAQYYRTVEDLRKLLEARAVVCGIAPLPQPDENIATLQDEIVSLEQQVADAQVSVDVGDLSYYPVKGQAMHVTSKFGYRYDPVGVRGYCFHYGIDLRSPHGTPIGAWFNGTVIKTGTSYGGGKYVWLDHGDGVRSYYCHLSTIQVTAGQVVKQGDTIALSGNTGAYTTGPHLHLGLYIDGVAVDPYLILGGAL